MVRIWFLSLSITILIGCADLQDYEQGEPANLPDVELFQAEVVMSEGARKLFIVRADKISQIEKLDIMLLDGNVRVDFFGEDGEHTGMMTSSHGEVLNKENKLKAIGNVRVNSDSGMQLLAEELYYDSDFERVQSDGFVTVVTETDSLSGYGFSSAPDLSDWEIKNTSGTTWRNIEDRKKSNSASN